MRTHYSLESDTFLELSNDITGLLLLIPPDARIHHEDPNLHVVEIRQ